MIIVNLKKLFIGILGSIIGYIIINLLIIDLSIFQYLGIELVITLAHYVYNRIKASLELEEQS